jgi:hypothetical protein
MGLFSFIGKAVGAVARTALGVATGGASEVALKAAKGIAGALSKGKQKQVSYPYRKNVIGLPGGRYAVGGFTHPLLGRPQAVAQRPILTVGGRMATTGAALSATPVMPGGARAPVADPVRVLRGGGKRRSATNSGKRKRSSTSRGRSTKRRAAPSTRHSRKSSRSGKVKYKGKWYSAKQARIFVPRHRR